MSNNQIEKIKQFLYSEICERRDYSASRMCYEVLKFIEESEKLEKQLEELTAKKKQEEALDFLTKQAQELNL